MAVVLEWGLSAAWSAHCRLFSSGVCDEPAAGGTVGLCPALSALPAHGLLPVHRVDLYHHCMQDALSAQDCQPTRVL